MKVLHTSDWHVGKKLGSVDRTDEFLAAIQELHAICQSRSVDAVLLSGDVWDKGTPTPALMDIGIDAMRKLSNDGAIPVIAIAGNHDSAPFFEAMGKILKPYNIHFVGDVKPPDSGGIVKVDTNGGPLAVGCVPFFRRGSAVDLMDDSSGWYGQYQEKLRNIFESYARSLAIHQSRGAVTMLMAHATVNGADVRLQADGRGERSLHMGEDYAIEGSDFPASIQYVAMGHIHAPQSIKNSSVPAEYAGTLLPLDFGERNERKRVVVVEAVPGTPVRIESVELATASRRPLVRLTGDWEAIMDARNKLLTELPLSNPHLDPSEGPYFDIVVETDGADLGLGDMVRENFANVVKVRSNYEHFDIPVESRRNKPFAESYKEYFQAEYGRVPDADLMNVFAQVLEQTESRLEQDLMTTHLEGDDATD